MTMQLNFFDKTENEQDLLEELFQAYFDCRKNKRNTINALRFEKHLERNIFELYEEVESGTYTPSRSIAFVMDKPVKREIFAADFRDRVVHHFIINKLNPYFEEIFIEDSYACRVAKGTHYGINRISKFIQECSFMYTKDCYVLKLDIEGFFLNIDKEILHDGLKAFVTNTYNHEDRSLLISLCEKIIYNDPTNNCLIKGSKSDWDGLPKSKSLFHSKSNCGLPIGNLTSQIFANFYMDTFDHYIKHDLGIKYYGRYVDDFVIVHSDKEYLKRLIEIIRTFLKVDLGLDLHPKKIYLQHFTKGVPFLGTFIKPNRIYIGKRTKSNFYKAILNQNEVTKKAKPTFEEQVKFQSSMNSYLGIVKHYDTYRLRKKMLWKHLNPYWWNVVYLSGGYSKFVRKIKKGAVSNK